MRGVNIMRTRQGIGWLLVLLTVALVGPVRSADQSPVAAAAKAGDIAAVRALIAERADVNAPEADGSTALLWAAYNSDLEMVRVLITAGADLEAANRYGVTPLLQVSRAGDVAILQALIEAGANPLRARFEGETPLMAAAYTGSVEAARLLLASGVDVNARDYTHQQTALMWAASQGHVEAVETLLEAGADPNLTARENTLARKHADHPTGGFTAVMWAAREGYDDVVRALVAGGADLSMTNGDNATATIIALVNDRFDMAGMLLDLGAPLNDGSLYFAVDMHDATTDMRARDGSILRANHPNELTALDLVQKLLDLGADPNQRWAGTLHSTALGSGDNHNASPFFRAAVASDVEVLELLIERGADVEWVLPAREGGGGSRRGSVGKTGLMVTMNGGRGAAFGGGPGFGSREGPPPFREPGDREPLEAMKLLLAAGADPDTKAADGTTALHQAAQGGNLDAVRVLAEAGATLDVTNRDGLTALEVAEGKEAEGGRRGRGARGGGNGGGRGRGNEPDREVAALLRELMGLPPAPIEPVEEPEAAEAAEPAEAAADDAAEEAEEAEETDAADAARAEEGRQQ